MIEMSVPVHSKGSQKLKILHCPWSVGGNAYALSRAERAMGYSSDMLAFTGSRFKYRTDFTMPRNRFLSFFYCVFWLTRALFKYDVIHYNFGDFLSPKRRVIYDDDRFFARWYKNALNLLLGPMELIDVRILRLFGKAIYITYQGDDARQRDYCLEHYAINFARSVHQRYYSEHGDNLKRSWIVKAGKLAHRVFALNPDLLNVLPPTAEFLPYSIETPSAHFPQQPDNPVPVILHAPSNRAVKGTDFLMAALGRLKKEGVRFKLTLLEGVPNEQAREMYKSADIVVDQLLAGWYGAFASEAMAAGKPVIAYIRQTDLVHIEDIMKAELPIVSATPETVYDVLKQMLKLSTAERQQLGQRSFDYVKKWHDPIFTARLVNGKRN